MFLLLSVFEIPAGKSMLPIDLFRRFGLKSTEYSVGARPDMFAPPAAIAYFRFVRSAVHGSVVTGPCVGGSETASYIGECSFAGNLLSLCFCSPNLICCIAAVNVRPERVTLESESSERSRGAWIGPVMPWRDLTGEYECS